MLSKYFAKTFPPTNRPSQNQGSHQWQNYINICRTIRHIDHSKTTLTSAITKNSANKQKDKYIQQVKIAYQLIQKRIEIMRNLQLQYILLSIYHKCIFLKIFVFRQNYLQMFGIYYKKGQFILFMLIVPQQRNLDEWKQSLSQYQYSKRTKRPFGKAPPTPQANLKQEFLQKQMKFNPVLQNFRDQLEMSKTIEHQEVQKAQQQFKHLKNNYKYKADYDIINLHPTISLPVSYKSQSMSLQTRKKEYKDPTYYKFNIIDGSNYNDNYLKNRSFRQEKRYERNIHHKDRTYNIINNTYPDISNSLDDHQTSLGFSSLKRKQFDKNFDPVSGIYYNPEEQQNFQKQRKAAEQQKAHKINTKLPPSYNTRQPLTLDQIVKPSPIIQALDIKKQKAKQRYKLRYLVQDEHQLRILYDSQRQAVILKNRVHEGRLEQQKAREFNILNSKAYQQRRTEKLFGKQITGGVYDVRGYASSRLNTSIIKNSGFRAQIQQ